ncbi:MAG TPA: hypothetical protein VFZ97_16255 [Acidimicrobiales bacterium]
MTSRDQRKYIDSLLEGRQPSGFRADADEARIIRTVITLRGAREDSAEPREEFMSGLFDELAAGRQHPDASVVPIRRPRRAAILSAAAAVLVAGTFGVSEAVDQSRSAPAAVSVNGGVHSSALLDASRRVVGQINLYGGSPSWVFMNLHEPGSDGTAVCQLRGANGGIELTGSFQVTGGEGQWARTINDNLSRIRSAQIVTSTGTTLATATFS